MVAMNNAYKETKIVDLALITSKNDYKNVLVDLKKN